MFDFARKEPKKPFPHAYDCKGRQDRSQRCVQVVGHPTWRVGGDLRFGKDHYYESSAAERRVRLDPYDPLTSRHAPQCEQREIADAMLLKALLKVQPGSGGEYHWVTYGASTRRGPSRTTPRRARETR